MRTRQTIFLIAAVIGMAACQSTASTPGSAGAAGSPQRGTAAILRYGCGSCHLISGIRAARGLVGPPLQGIRDRQYVAGMLENTRDNLQLWIRNPKAVNPKTAMPVLGLSEQDASDIATYLYSRD